MDLLDRGLIGVALEALVLIPDGMEFYLSKLQRAPDFGGFQFPTGWNSTCCRGLCSNMR